MKRDLVRVALACAVAVSLVPAAGAGVKTEERTRLQFGGALGGILNKLGGKAAKEGVVQRVAVVGDRKLTLGDERGEIVDLAEERIYELDVKKKAYTVTTFAELKKRIEEQRAKAEEQAAEARKQQEEREAKEGQGEAPAKEYEVDVEMSETGQKRPIAGHEARQVAMKAWVHEKGKKIQQSGGLLIATDTWLGPKIDALEEIVAFDRRYALKMAEILGFTTPAASAAAAAQMTSILALYPQVQGAMEKLRAEAEKVNMEGTTLASGITITLWKSPAEVAQAQKQSADMGGGLGGLLAKKIMKQGDPSDPRSEVFSSSTEMLRITPEAAEADVAVPAGYRQK